MGGRMHRTVTFDQSEVSQTLFDSVDLRRPYGDRCCWIIIWWKGL